MISPASEPLPFVAENNFLLRTLHVVWRWRKRAALFFGVTLGLIVVGVFVVPRTYQSEAKVFVRLGRESVTLDPTATTGKVVGVYESRENELNSVLDVMNSRIILERVVDHLGADVILTERLPETVGTPSGRQRKAPAAGEPVRNGAGEPVRKMSPLPRDATSSAGDTKRDKAIRRLERMVYIKHSKKSSVITVGCKAASPELAQRIVQQVLEEFRGVHLQINRTAGSQEFFEKQTRLIAGQLKAARQELQDAKNRLGISTLEHRRKTLQELIRANRTAALTNAAELSGVQASLRSLQDSLAKLPQTTTAQKVVGFPNGSLDRARSQLNALQLREQQLLSRYTAHHPEVIAVRQQIAEAKKIVQREAPHAAQSTTAVPPARQQLQIRLYTEQARERSLRSQAETLDREYQQLLAELRELNAHEGQIARLEEKVQLLEQSHKAYAEKLEQARIDWVLARERISNINVVQPPSYVPKPVAPKKRLIVFLGMIAAGIGSLGLAWLSEFLQWRRQRVSAAPAAEAEGRTPLSQHPVAAGTT